MDRPWLNYHHLYYFMTIAQEGGIVKAAKKLRLGQPTLSTQLKLLEEQMGQALFERKKKRLYLTDAGHIALNYATEIFRMGDELIDTLADRQHVDRVDMQFGCQDGVPKAYASQLIQHAHAHRNCHVTCVEGHGNQLLKDLKAHRLDLLLTNHPPPPAESSGLFARRIGRFPVGVYGPKRFQKLSKDFPDSLDRQAFVLPTTDSPLRAEVEEFFRSRQLKIDILAEIQDSSLQRLLSSEGLGLIALPERAARSAVEGKELFLIGRMEDVFEELWLIAGERRIQNPLAAELLKSFSLNA